jgi:hypothetical protein
MAGFRFKSSSRWSRLREILRAPSPCSSDSAEQPPSLTSVPSTRCQPQPPPSSHISGTWRRRRSVVGWANRASPRTSRRATSPRSSPEWPRGLALPTSSRHSRASPFARSMPEARAYPTSHPAAPTRRSLAPPSSCAGRTLTLTLPSPHTERRTIPSPKQSPARCSRPRCEQRRSPPLKRSSARDDDLPAVATTRPSEPRARHDVVKTGCGRRALNHLPFGYAASSCTAVGSISHVSGSSSSMAGCARRRIAASAKARSTRPVARANASR